MRRLNRLKRQKNGPERLRRNESEKKPKKNGNEKRLKKNGSEKKPKQKITTIIQVTVIKRRTAITMIQQILPSLQQRTTLPIKMQLWRQTAVRREKKLRHMHVIS